MCGRRFGHNLLAELCLFHKYVMGMGMGMGMRTAWLEPWELALARTVGIVNGSTFMAGRIVLRPSHRCVGGPLRNCLLHLREFRGRETP